MANTDTSTLKESISEFTTSVGSINDKVKLLGSGKDCMDLRTSINGSIARAQGQMQAIIENIKKIQTNVKVFSKAQKQELEKVTQDFYKVATQFKTISDTAAKNERTFLVKQRSVNPFDSDSPSTDAQLIETRNQQLAQLESEVDISAQIIEEREQAIKHLEDQVVEVNQIFRDLASLVDLQQRDIDHITDNIEITVNNTSSGVQNLEEAKQEQKKSRKKMLIILAIVAAVFVVGVLLIIISLV